MVLHSNTFRKFLSHLCAILSLNSANLQTHLQSSNPMSEEHYANKLSARPCNQTLGTSKAVGDGDCIECPEKVFPFSPLSTSIKASPRNTLNRQSDPTTHKIPSELTPKLFKQASAMLKHLKDAPGKGCRRLSFRLNIYCAELP
jgi:hypothetical protein